MGLESLIVIKPDAIRRGLAGEIIRRLERKGVRFVRLRMLRMTSQHVNQLYAKFVGQKFMKRISEFMTSGPVICMVAWTPAEESLCIPVVRTLMGAFTAPQAGTIRGDFARMPNENMMHASDGADAAAREIQIFFPGWPGDVGAT